MNSNEMEKEKERPYRVGGVYQCPVDGEVVLALRELDGWPEGEHFLTRVLVPSSNPEHAQEYPVGYEGVQYLTGFVQYLTGFFQVSPPESTEPQTSGLDPKVSGQSFVYLLWLHDGVLGVYKTYEKAVSHLHERIKEADRESEVKAPWTYRESEGGLRAFQMNGRYARIEVERRIVEEG